MRKTRFNRFGYITSDLWSSVLIAANEVVIAIAESRFSARDQFQVFVCFCLFVFFASSLILPTNTTWRIPYLLTVILSPKVISNINFRWSLL